MARMQRHLAGLVAVVILALPICTNAAEKNADPWRFTLAPYAWLAGQSGSVGTLPGLPPADIDVDDSRIALSGGPAPTVERTNKEDWIDPVIGLKGRSFLGGSKFFVDGGLMLGLYRGVRFHVGRLCQPPVPVDPHLCHHRWVPVPGRRLQQRRIRLRRVPGRHSHGSRLEMVSKQVPPPAGRDSKFQIQDSRFSGGKCIRILWSSSVSLIHRETSIKAPVFVGPVTAPARQEKGRIGLDDAAFCLLGRCGDLPYEKPRLRARFHIRFHKPALERGEDQCVFC